jgi:hypothetical protein
MPLPVLAIEDDDAAIHRRPKHLRFVTSLPVVRRLVDEDATRLIHIGRRHEGERAKAEVHGLRAVDTEGPLQGRDQAPAAHDEIPRELRQMADDGPGSWTSSRTSDGAFIWQYQFHCRFRLAGSEPPGPDELDWPNELTRFSRDPLLRWHLGDVSARGPRADYPGGGSALTLRRSLSRDARSRPTFRVLHYPTGRTLEVVLCWNLEFAHPWRVILEFIGP